MVLRSVAVCMDSGDWLQGGGMQQAGFKAPVEDMLSCPRPFMDRRLKPNAELALKCPRCDSSNTKFCYYNNYSLTQPRYFCKACRRYWTKGGSLRNVPVGGGCRKNKRFKRTPDPPVQTEQSAASAPAINNNEMNSCSPPGLDHSNLNLPAMPSVYFALLNGGADGLGVAYANRSVPQQNHQALRVAAPSGGPADRPLMVGNCNTSSGILEIQATATATATATHQPLASLSNLNTFQSLKAAANLITSGGPEQSALLHVSGDLTSIFEAHHHQQVPTSSTPAISNVSDNRFHDVTLHNSRLNSGLINDQDVQWQQHHLQQNIVMPVEDHESGHVPLPFDHDDANAVEELRPHNDVKLRQFIMNGVQGVQSPLGGEENRLSFNWQLPSAESEGLMDTSGNNMSYWNGGTWPDLSCYAPYTNSLI